MIDSGRIRHDRRRRRGRRAAIRFGWGKDQRWFGWCSSDGRRWFGGTENLGGAAGSETSTAGAKATGTTLVDTHGDYPVAMRQLAVSKHVDLVDATALTKAYFERIGQTAPGAGRGTQNKSNGSKSLARRRR